MAKKGRPSTYTVELANKICSLLADGQSLRAICLQENMPNKDTVYGWLSKHSDFSDNYARAKSDCADLFAEEIIEIADDSQGDRKIINRAGEEIEIVDQDAINRARLRVDARKWIASKLKPKKYGEHLDIDQHVSAESILVSVDGKEMLKLQVSESRETK
jgi:hypothetical protein